MCLRSLTLVHPPPTHTHTLTHACLCTCIISISPLHTTNDPLGRICCPRNTKRAADRESPSTPPSTSQPLSIPSLLLNPPHLFSAFEPPTSHPFPSHSHSWDSLPFSSSMPPSLHPSPHHLLCPSTTPLFSLYHPFSITLALHFLPLAYTAPVQPPFSPCTPPFSITLPLHLLPLSYSAPVQNP